MRKLRGDTLDEDLKNINNSKADDDEDDDDDDLATTGGRGVGGGARPKQRINPFEMLNVGGGEDSCSEVKEDDGGTESSRSNSAAVKRNKKKKNRKKVTKASKAAAVKSSEDNLEDFEDEIDRSVREVNKILGKAPSAQDAKLSVNSGAPVVVAVRGILSIETRNLNPDNEMKKIFGSRVVEGHRSAHHHHHPRQQGPGGGRGAPARVRAQTRAAHAIIAHHHNWPKPTKTGLSMRFLESDKQGNQHFTFEHSPSYQTVQKRFYGAVESMNPDFIVQLLNEHPFHVDSMLQLSDICKMGEDSQMATELVERTLFTMEASFHTMFSLTSGTSRLDYRRQENRSFFIALFRHLVSVGGRACYRTSLEFCKLLLSLDPECDPTGVLLMLDFYAIRAAQHAWFVRLYEEWEPSRNLSQLPNWAYGVAVARFHCADDGDKDFSKADEMLQTALINFPGVLLPLLDKCSIEPEDKVARHLFFVDSQRGQQAGLELLTRLYVGRSYHVWKVPEILPWLERNCRVVLDRVDGGDAAVKLAAEKRKLRYQGTPRNVYRHVIMSDIKDATTSLPKELSEEAVMSFDPVPPTDSIDLYKGNARRGGGGTDDSGTLSLFLRSLLPNFDANAPAAQAPPRGDAAAAAAGGAGVGEDAGDDGGAASLRASFNSVYEAMQDLLGNLHLPEIPQDGADSEDSDDEYEWQ